MAAASALHVTGVERIAWVEERLNRNRPGVSMRGRDQHALRGNACTTLNDTADVAHEPRVERQQIDSHESERPAMSSMTQARTYKSSCTPLALPRRAAKPASGTPRGGVMQTLPDLLSTRSHPLDRGPSLKRHARPQLDDPRIEHVAVWAGCCRPADLSSTLFAEDSLREIQAVEPLARRVDHVHPELEARAPGKRRELGERQVEPSSERRAEEIAWNVPDRAGRVVEADGPQG